jgi:hypothetical protein
MVTSTEPRRVAASPRTGPLGRLARLGWAAATAMILASIVDGRGPARFRNPHVLTEPSAWLLHAVMLVAFVLLVGAIASALGGRQVARRAQVGTLVAVAGTVALAGAVGHLAYGAVWGFPLADLVWSFDVLVLAQQVVALVLAIALGTPGCEIGVWPELIARRRGERSSPSAGLACIVGLHLVDAWEARHRASTWG